jgi:hypothetical protein
MIQPLDQPVSVVHGPLRSPPHTLEHEYSSHLDIPHVYQITLCLQLCVWEGGALTIPSHCR